MKKKSRYCTVGLLFCMLLLVLCGCGDKAADAGEARENAVEDAAISVPSQVDDEGAPSRNDDEGSPSRSGDEGDVFRVSDLQGFIDAIGPNRTIILEGGDSGFGIDGGGAMGANPYVSERTEVISGRDYGDSIIISNVDNLTIIGGGSGYYRLFTESMYKNALVFSGCQNLTLENIALIHPRPEGSAGGLRILESSSVTIRNARINRLLHLYGVQGLTVENAEIGNSPGSLVDINDSADIRFDSVSFRDTLGEGPAIEVSGDARGIYFTDCLFVDLQNHDTEVWPQLLSVYRSAENIEFRNCTFRGNEALLLTMEGDDYTRFINCTFSRNLFEANGALHGEIWVAAIDYPDTNWALDDGYGETLEARSMPMAFGFADASGSRLLHQMYYGYKHEDIDALDTDPTAYTLAVGPYCEAVPITFEGWQEENEQNDYRDVAYNFDNLPGYVYRAAGGVLQPDATHMLVESRFADTIIPLHPPVPDVFRPTLGINYEIFVTERKDRAVAWSEHLGTTEEGATIGLFMFEREGDDMLFSIAYLYGDKAIFWDCPAEYSESSTWRVDMGDEPGAFTPLFLAREDGRLVLILAWGAPEGEAIVVLHENDASWESASAGYARYWSPA